MAMKKKRDTSGLQAAVTAGSDNVVNVVSPLEPKLLGIAQVASESRGLLVVWEQHLNCRQSGLSAEVSWDRCF